jgi:3',5'-cyclic AMP phosphodiesterase CpdA
VSQTDEFPLIISPNLGCPHIISIDEIKQEKTFTLVIAGRYGELTTPLKDGFKGTLFLRASSSSGKASKDIQLSIKGEVEEIAEWNKLSDINDIEDTRDLINSEYHYNVLGENTRYWRVKVSLGAKNIEDPDSLLHQKDGKNIPCLYDIVYIDKFRRGERVNYHSIQFVESTIADCKFIQITDPHIATRNDGILDEVLKIKSKRSRDDIIEGYINFNENLRDFIKHANNMADNGELDFVVITGDLVDFAFHGWEDESNPDENNWKTFINIITGAGNENERNNIGLKVAVFTSTGNHDWRLHPYDPNLTKYNRDSFGLHEDELKHYKYKSFDSSEYPDDKRAKLSKMVADKALNKMNLDAFSDKWTLKLAKTFYGSIVSKALKILPASLGVAAVGTGAGAGTIGKVWHSILPIAFFAVVALVIWGVKKFIEWKTAKVVDMMIDNPIHAEASALHYYLKHVNPYFDYAFQYGKHSFIVMDTGADVFIGQFLDGKQIKHIKKMSIRDNILGGSPDTRAFDDEQIYYNWEQIVWLEKVMTFISKDSNGNSRMFVFLHSPPINPPDDEKFDNKQDKLVESNRSDPTWISKEECYLTYGTINHYLSQFFYLCTGYRESELIEPDVYRNLKPVDIVFAGHAHRNIEFRVEKDINHKIRIYHDKYGDNYDYKKPYEWWGKGSPLMVQTASCSIAGRNDKNPPYFRKVTIDKNQGITEFKQVNV